MDEPARLPTILIVEDNRETRLLLNHFLGGRYRLTLAATVDEAIEHATTSSFDLLIVDINLGEKRTGFDVLASARSRSYNDAVSALALTAYALAGDRELCISRGFNGYLAKPFTSQQLYRECERLLGQDAGERPRSVRAD